MLKPTPHTNEVEDAIKILNEAIVKEGGDIYMAAETVISLTLNISEVISIRKVLGKCFNMLAFGERYDEGGT